MRQSKFLHPHKLGVSDSFSWRHQRSSELSGAGAASFWGEVRGLENPPPRALHVFMHQVLKISCVWGQKGALHSPNMTTHPEQARSLPAFAGACK